MSLEEARRAWIADEPAYRAFGVLLLERITRVVSALGISAEVSSRTKAVDSLLRKLMVKKQHTYESLPDKLGVRIILRYQHEVQPVISSLAAVINCQDIEAKADRLKADQIGYRATHLQISLLKSDSEEQQFPMPRFVAELQIHTMAQNLWANMSHDAFYKIPEMMDPRLQRRINLLAGLIEVADNEFSRIEGDLATMPDLRNVLILRALERQYYKLSARPGNPDLSLQVIEHLVPLYEEDPEDWGNRFETLFQEKQHVLKFVFLEQAEQPYNRSAFMFQPEILMIYDRLLHDRYKLQGRWIEMFPEQELERIANVFGFSFD